MKCINCGKPTSGGKPTPFGLCQACINSSNQLSNLLNDGLKIIYRDGSERTIKVPKPQK